MVSTSHTIRSIRAALAEHFDVDVDDLKEEKKGVIKASVDKAVEELLPAEGDEEESEEEEVAAEGKEIAEVSLHTGLLNREDIFLADRVFFCHSLLPWTAACLL